MKRIDELKHEIQMLEGSIMHMCDEQWCLETKSKEYIILEDEIQKARRELTVLYSKLIKELDNGQI